MGSEAPHTSTSAFDFTSGLYTDMYELAMAQVYFRSGRHEVPACFDYAFRSIPYSGGYALFAGLQDLLDWLAGVHFSSSDIAYLAGRGFDRRFLDHLQTFSFNGTVWSVKEGEVVFPLEPIIRVEAGLAEAQLIETALLNLINFESLVATRAARIRQVAGDRTLSDFGLRRAHGLGGIHASRAAVVGGFDSTSNVFAARRYGLQAVGTMAHSFVQAAGDELTAFRQFAAAHPANCILLVDTFDTLESGLPNAIKIAREMEIQGRRLVGIRLDSGDLAHIAKEARKRLDAEGLTYVKIAVSNQLDEFLVKSLLDQGAPIDIFGVGTRLVTGSPDAALDGVYKLSAVDGQPRMKISDTLRKVTLPGAKQLVRYARNGTFVADAIILDGEAPPDRVHDPFERDRVTTLPDLQAEQLLEKAIEDGRSVQDPSSPAQIARYARQRLSRLPEEHKRLENPQVYSVGISRDLMALRDDIIQHHRTGDKP